jgi:hypothetical protein
MMQSLGKPTHYHTKYEQVELKVYPHGFNSFPIVFIMADGSFSVQRQPVQELAIGYLPAPEAAQAEELIGSMYLLIDETKGKIHRVGPQNAEEQLADGDAPTNA